MDSMTLFNHKGTMRVGSKENPITLPEVEIKANKMLRFDFDLGRKELFKDGYSQLQVDSINAIVSEANEQGISSKAQLSYILATARHEGNDYDGKTTGKVQSLVPIREKGGESYLKSKKYYPFVGMGFVQITWDYNYKKFAPIIKKKFGVDIMDNPEQLLRTDVSAFIIVYGMINGSFTGKKLSDYITTVKTDFPNARKIVNGEDKKALIATYASQFLKCIV